MRHRNKKLKKISLLLWRGRGSEQETQLKFEDGGWKRSGEPSQASMLGRGGARGHMEFFPSFALLLAVAVLNARCKTRNRTNATGPPKRPDAILQPALCCRCSGATGARRLPPEKGTVGFASRWGFGVCDGNLDEGEGGVERTLRGLKMCTCEVSLSLAGPRCEWRFFNEESSGQTSIDPPHTHTLSLSLSGVVACKWL